jgi:hypothetical protein
MSGKSTNREKGSVGEDEAGKKVKETQHAGGQSVSEKSQLRELVRTSLRNQTVRHNISSVRHHLTVPAISASPERLFSSVGLVKSDLRGRILDNTLIDVMWSISPFPSSSSLLPPFPSKCSSSLFAVTD